MINCFWVSGEYKGCGHSRALPQFTAEDVKAQGRDGPVTVVGTSKFHFIGDVKWLSRQGFETIEKLPYGFSLLTLRINLAAPDPSFNGTISSGECEKEEGVVVYYTYCCPFAEFHVRNSLVSVTENKGVPLGIVRLETIAQARNAPTPTTILSFFYKGKFVTTDLSTRTEQQFDKALGL